MAYDYSSLSDRDLEDLTRDILSIKLKVDFQSFKSGKDQGIDLRYSTNNEENEIVVQVKHFMGSTISKLKGVLKKQEVGNVKRLSPKRYFLVTSLPLSAKNKEDIKIILSPFIKSTADILGKENLTEFLRNHPDVVERHFKLWLSSTTVLTRILSNAISGRSDFSRHLIKTRVQKFVPCKSYEKAVDILNKRNFILITGAPGIGKTTTADMLACQLMAKDFKLVYVRDVREAEDMYKIGKKQIFYLDDFLGAATLQLQRSKNEDSAIVGFIERIKFDDTKKLILTCRTTILNRAKQESEAIENSKMEIARYEVEINSYSALDKARILYNHIFYSDLSKDLKSVFFRDKFYWTVIKHRHYTPRIVQFFTDVDLLDSSTDYATEVIDFLDDPSRIWAKSYNNQISNDARLLLVTLYSLEQGYGVTERKLQTAYNERLNYEVETNNYIKYQGTFHKVVRELLGGFISRFDKQETTYTIVEYKFFNPSIEDFIFSLFRDDAEDYLPVLKAATYSEQLTNRITLKENEKDKYIYLGGDREYSALFKIVNSRLAQIDHQYNLADIQNAVTLTRLFRWRDIEAQIIDVINNVLPSVLSWTDRDNLIELLEYVSRNNLSSILSIDPFDIILILSRNIKDYLQIRDISALVLKCPIYGNMIGGARISRRQDYDEFQYNIDEAWRTTFDTYITNSSSLNLATDRTHLSAEIQRKKLEAGSINEHLSIVISPAINEYTIDFDNIIDRNMKARSNGNTVIGDLNTVKSEVPEEIEIERLFNDDVRMPGSSSPGLIDFF
jgi:hypothetical protein